MRVLISGATGFVGSALAAALEAAGDEVVSLARKPTSKPHVLWDPAAGRLDPSHVEGFEAVVHLAGAGIADKRWSASRKAEIRDSRVNGTSLLAHAVAAASKRPSVFVSASATGFYGDRGDEVLTENSPAGAGYLAEVCLEWEAASRPVIDAGIRLALPRFGIVLDPAGGALAKMLPIFRFGLGGRLGNGRQWMSWISLRDLVSALRFLISTPEAIGAFNAVSPTPVTNADFTQVLGRALHRPTILPAPAFALRLVFGEMADAALLSSQRVLPARLEDAGFRFADPELGAGLKRMLGG